MRRVINDKDPPDEAILAGFRGLLERYSPSCVVSDAMERARTMRSDIKPAVGGRFVGSALTVRKTRSVEPLITRIGPPYAASLSRKRSPARRLTAAEPPRAKCPPAVIAAATTGP